MAVNQREGSLEAPTRHPINWKDDSYWNQDLLFQELERVYDICHGCRRCFNLCNSFPTLFDAIDESETMELDGVPKEVYWDVVDHCYLCDMCFMSKCPYVPPHEWNIDFPHLMLRAKAIKHRKGKNKLRDKFLANTDLVGTLAGVPVVNGLMNTTLQSKLGKKALSATLGIDQGAYLPEYHRKNFRKQTLNTIPDSEKQAGATSGKVVLFATCYGNTNEPQLNKDLVAIFQHNGIPVQLVDEERCCGMPQLELGNLEAVNKAKQKNIPALIKWVAEGWDIVAPVPSCVLMFKQELPLMFPDDLEVSKVAEAIYDPFEYLMIRYKSGLLNIDFKNPLGKISYHVACHQRVQNVGMKTKEVLSLIPDTEVEAIERCSGHDGTYAVKKEFHQVAMKIAKPIVTRIEKYSPDHFSSDCPIAGHHIANAMKGDQQPEHPLSLLRKAYGI